MKSFVCSPFCSIHPQNFLILSSFHNCHRNQTCKTWRDQADRSWTSGEWKSYRWNVFFWTLKITPRKKRLKITHSEYYPCEFKYRKALFLVTHQSTIFPTNLRKNITETQMQRSNVTKMPWLAGRASLGDCWVCLEGKLVIRLSNPLLTIVSSSGLGCFCSIKAW